MTADQEWRVFRTDRLRGLPVVYEVVHNRRDGVRTYDDTSAVGLLHLVREIASALQADPAPERGPFRWAARSTTHTRRTRP